MEVTAPRGGQMQGRSQYGMQPAALGGRFATAMAR